MSLLRVFIVLNMISSTTSFSRMSQWMVSTGLKSFLSIRVSQGFAREGSTLFLMKLSNAARYEYLVLFVKGFVCPVSLIRKDRISSDVMPCYLFVPKLCLQSGQNKPVRPKGILLGMKPVIPFPALYGFRNIHTAPPFLISGLCPLRKNTLIVNVCKKGHFVALFAKSNFW